MGRKQIMDINIENPITALLLFTTIAQTSPDANDAKEAAEQAQEVIDRYEFGEEVIASTMAMSKKLIAKHSKKYFIEVHLGDGSMSLVACSSKAILRTGLKKFQTDYPGSVQISFNEAFPALWNAIAEGRA